MMTKSISIIATPYPAPFSNALAYGTSDASQVGSGYGVASENRTHALLRSGTATSAVDLNPAAILHPT
jgi:hypothetical protein